MYLPVYILFRCAFINSAVCKDTRTHTNIDKLTLVIVFIFNTTVTLLCLIT
jgi:hypothetical protein